MTRRSKRKQARQKSEKGEHRKGDSNGSPEISRRERNVRRSRPPFRGKRKIVKLVFYAQSMGRGRGNEEINKEQ